MLAINGDGCAAIVEVRAGRSALSQGLVFTHKYRARLEFCGNGEKQFLTVALDLRGER